MNQLTAKTRTSLIAKADKERITTGEIDTAQTHFERERQRYFKDPENSDHKKAIAFGKANSMMFMNTIIDPTSPEHEKNLHIYKYEHNSNPETVEQFFIEKSCADSGTSEFEKQDPTYEANVLRKFKPTGNITHIDQAMFQNFYKNVKDHWNQVGYRDSTYVEDIAKKYNMKSNDNLVDLIEFRLKN